MVIFSNKQLAQLILIAYTIFSKDRQKHVTNETENSLTYSFATKQSYTEYMT